jgi:hypothetical protein
MLTYQTRPNGGPKTVHVHGSGVLWGCSCQGFAARRVCSCTAAEGVVQRGRDIVAHREYPVQVTDEGHG